MARKNANGDWLDARGKAVPPAYVKPVDRKRDATVEGIVNQALQLEARMKALKAKWLKKIRDFQVSMMQEAQVELSGKGNICLTNFSGDKQVEFNILDIIEFDENLQVAKAIIDQCLTRWSADAHPHLRVVIQQAFEVDKKGRINTQAILKLLSLNIRDAEWQKAMDKVAESVHIAGSRQYLNIRVRNASTERFRTVKLNMSSI